VLTEELLTWEGLTEGIGSQGDSRGVVPEGSTVAGTEVLRPLEAVASGAGVVARILQVNEDELTLASLDERGRVTGLRTHEPELIDGLRALPQVMVAAGGGVRIIAKHADSSGVAMLQFDETGQQRLPVAPVSLLTGPLGGTDDNVIVAADGYGDRVWLTYAKRIVEGEELRTVAVRAFDASGAPISGEYELASRVAPSAISQMAVAVSRDRALVAWSLGEARHYAVFDNATGALLAQRVMDQYVRTAYPFVDIPEMGFVNVFGTAAWRLNDAFEPVVAAGKELWEENILPSWAPATINARPRSTAGGLLLSGVHADYVWPQEQTYRSQVDVVYELTLKSGRLADSNSAVPLFRQPLAEEGFVLTGALPVGDRVVLVGYDVSTHQLRTLWFWR
jgi:hypothetical protein